MSEKDNKEVTEEGLKEVISAMFEAFKPKTEAEEFQMWKHLFNENTKDVLEDIFIGYICFMEGSACSVDKSRSIVKRLIQSCEKGENIKLQYTYIEYREKGGNLGGLANRPDSELDHLCYWCPETIEDTRQAISIYFIVTGLHFKELRRMYDEHHNKVKPNV